MTKQKSIYEASAETKSRMIAKLRALGLDHLVALPQETEIVDNGVTLAYRTDRRDRSWQRLAGRVIRAVLVQIGETRRLRLEKPL